MKNILKLTIWIVIILINIQFTYAELPWYTCMVHWKIVWFDEYFIKPDCFKLTKLKVLWDDWGITEFTAATRYHDTCFKAYFNWWYQIQDVLSLPQFIPDYKQIWKTYFFKIEDWTMWIVYAYTWWLNNTAKNIPIDNIWEIPVNSIMSGYFTYESDELKSLAKCPSYKLDINNKNIELIDNWKVNIYKYLIFWVILWILSCLLLILIYKIIKNKKQV